LNTFYGFNTTTFSEKVYAPPQKLDLN